MTLATWNIERLKHKKNLQLLREEIKKIDADILVLTEYDERLELDYPFQISTKFVQSFRDVQYAPTERRVKIFSRYEIMRSIYTFNEHTSCCVELKTEMGNLIVYGAIIGILGNRDANFKEDLALQIEDFRRIAKDHPLCIMGDFNISFHDHYYFTHHGRIEISKIFEELSMKNLTVNIKDNIDHIVVSNSFAHDHTIGIGVWNSNPQEVTPLLSDHQGVWASILL